MSESARHISHFQRRVLSRKRLISLQDHLAVAIMAGGLFAAAAVLYVKMRPLAASMWVIVLAMIGTAVSAALARWFFARPGADEAAFEIDRKLALEDRITTAASIITRGKPVKALEEALLDDAAERIKEVEPAEVVPYRFSKWLPTSLLGAAALVVAMMVPQAALPSGETLVAERADIETAGEHLEEAAKEVEQFVPPETVTADLAREQAELGRALRRSAGSRAEALKKLSELEGRIRQRHGELAETRADEIVSLAEKRLQPVTATKPKESVSKTPSKAGDETASIAAASENAQPANAQSTNPPTGAEKRENAGQLKDAQTPNEKPDLKESSPKSSTDGKKAGDVQTTPQQARSGENKTPDSTSQQGERAAQPGSATHNQSGQEKKSEPSISQSPTGTTPSTTPQQRAGEQTSEDRENPKGLQQSAGQQGSEGQKIPEGQKPEGGQDSANPLTNMMAEQAARAVPSLSQELLKKAEQLRAGQIKPEDIQQLAKAAESLARDLAPIAQSKEFQQALEQLARQVNPQQLEEVARQLLSQENIRRELEAAARLLMQNRQARELAAGIARQFDQMDSRPPGERQTRPDNPNIRASRNGGQGSGENGSGAGRGSAGNNKDQLAASNRLAGQGKDKKLDGRIQKKDGGEYLFLQSRPDVGAA
ncbi:MAG TPA: hypothetical protein VLD57_04435, partial [Blastocatellia bacterium]|nr:hypothetical protein [Blastocatellia bacterium]